MKWWHRLLKQISKLWHVSGLPRIKRDVELTFDLILKNLAFAPKRYLFPVTSNMFMFLLKPIFSFYKFRSWPTVCCETRYRKSTEMVVKEIKHPQSRGLSVQWCLWYCINVFVQMVKIFSNWLMCLVDRFQWNFCIVVRVRALTSLSRILKNQPFAPTWF